MEEKNSLDKCLQDYKLVFPDKADTELEVLFIKDTMNQIGHVEVSLEEAEEIWRDHSLSMCATWLGIPERTTMEGLFTEIVGQTVIDVNIKTKIFKILEKERIG